MKKFFSENSRIIRNIIIFLASVYLITVIERTLLKDDSQTEIMIEHATEKAQMTTKIDLLNNQIHKYELQLLKIRADVSDMSNDQLDSTWSTIFN